MRRSPDATASPCIYSIDTRLSENSGRVFVDILAALKTLSQLEEGLADLYERYSRVHAEDPEAAALFFRMSSQERTHASMVEYQKRLVRQNPELFSGVLFDGEGVPRVSAAIEIARIRASYSSLEEAVITSGIFESEAAEAHYRSAIRGDAPELSRLLEGLADSDRRHRAELEIFALRRRIQIDMPAPPAARPFQQEEPPG